MRSFLRLKKNLTFFFAIYIYIYIYIYLYIYVDIYLYISIYIYWKKERNVLRSFAFFCKRTKRSRVLLRSLQKNETFSAFFYVLCKRTLRYLRSFTFLWKERKRTHCFFGSHKSPETRKKNVAFFKRTLKNATFRTEKNAVPNPACQQPDPICGVCQ